MGEPFYGPRQIATVCISCQSAFGSANTVSIYRTEGYSADPAKIFSGVVACAAEVSIFTLFWVQVLKSAIIAAPCRP